MNISARVATVGDDTEIVAIGSVLADEIRDRRGGALHLAELESSWSERPPETDGLCVVGCIDDVVVGFANVRWRRIAADDLVADIVAYGVLEDARGVGVGEAMIGFVIERSVEARCCGIDAQALPGERETKNFFETFGFTARRLVVHHRL